jgi:hypothetical protein
MHLFLSLDPEASIRYLFYLPLQTSRKGGKKRLKVLISLQPPQVVAN